MNANLSKACQDVYRRITQAVSAIPSWQNPQDRAAMTKAVMGDIGKKKTSAADKIVAYQINSILSGVKTAVANIVSIPFQGVLTPVNDVIATLLRKGRGEDVAVADVLAGFRNIMDNFRIAANMSHQGYLRGFPLDVEGSIESMAYTMKLSKADARKALDNMILTRKAELSAQASGQRVEDVAAALKERNVGVTDEERSAFINENYDYYRNVFTGPLSQYINVPTKVTVGIDEFGKSFFRVYKAQQMAWAKARKEAKRPEDVERLYDSYRSQMLQGAIKGNAKDSLAQLRGEMGKIFGRGADDLIPYENLREFSAAKMFQQPLTGVPRQAHNMLKEVPLMRLWVPFLKTPWNISKEGLSYVPGFAPLTKAVLRPRLDTEGNVNTAFRGAYYELDKDQMIARQIVGLGALTGLWTMLDSNEITGTPRNSQERQAWIDAKIPAQSIKIGDTWYPYGRIEPVATVVQLVAEMKRVAKELDDNPRNLSIEDKFNEVMLGVKNAIMDKTFLEGFNNMIDDAREGKLLSAVGTAARQAVPTMLSDVARSMDGVERQARNPIEAAQQRIPVLRESLPEEYGLYGGVRQASQSQIWLGMSTTSESDLTPLQKAIQLVGVNKVRPNDKLKNVGLSDEQLAEYRKITAQILTPRLEGLASSSRYQSLPKGQQKVVMEKAIDKLKAGAAKYYYQRLLRTSPQYAREFLIEEYIKRGYDEQARALANQ